MSNEACLFAENTPAPYNPFVEEYDPAAETHHVAGAAFQIPIFWLACFERSDLTGVPTPEGDIPALCAEMANAARLLERRDDLMRRRFAAHAAEWAAFRRAATSHTRRYLKVDGYEVWLLYEDDSALARALASALNWFDTQNVEDWECLLDVAGVEKFDDAVGALVVEDDDTPARLLYGWLENE